MFRAWQHWLQRKRRAATVRERFRAPRRLCVERLEDRTLPSFVAAPTFTVGTNAGVGSTPIAVVSGDFNSDGILDVVTANQGSNTLSVLHGNGNGTFKAATNIALAKAPKALLAVDLSGDGRLDLVVANQSDNSISVLINNGLGGFKAAVTYAAGAGPVALAYGDFNDDGHTDLAVADSGASAVTLLLGDGHGHLTAGGTVTGIASPTSVAVGDFNHDGYSDIATVSGGFAHLDVNLNNGDGTFAPAVNYTTGFVANAVVVGDFNHDGNTDLAVACKFPSGDGISILLGNSDGTFQTFAKYSVGGQTPITLAVGDFNGDGFQDLVTANGQFGNNSVSVLFGVGDGTFANPLVFTAGQNPQAVAIGDFNRDGLLDVVAADTGGPAGCVSVLIGNGDGTFVAAPDLVVSGPGPAVNADFTNDGITDLAVITTSTSYSGVLIFPSNGNGSFGAPIATVQINQPSALTVGDFNGDHNMDLAVTTASGVSILLGNGDGTFGTRYDYAAGPSPTWLVVDDFNGDTIPDLAVADNNASGSVSLLLGNGDGTFQTASSIAGGGAASYVASADFNGDGKKDLVVINNSVNKFSIALGNGDGTFAPAASYATATDPSSVAVGDFNGDHKIDLAIPSFFGSSTGKTLTIYQNNGHGIFSLKAGYPTDSRPIGVTATDFNGDHRLDLATVNNFADTVSVYSATTTGSFSGPTTYVVGDRPTWVAATDFNGDGMPDLAVVNSNSGTVTLLETPQPLAAHFRVSIIPTTATAGAAFQITVTALNSNNQLLPSYAGTATFTSTDAAAKLPAAYKFTTADHGIHRFTVTLKTVGSRDIIAHAGGATGTGSITVVPAVANHLQLSTAAAGAGTPFDVTVTARDPYGNVATSFQATIHFSTSDHAAGVSLPADYTFTAGDNGVHTFTAGVTLITAGARTLTVTDTLKTTIKTTATVTVSAAALSQFHVSGIPLTAVLNTQYSFTVIAQDAFGNTVTNYLGTVQFTNSGGTAVLPGPYTFTAADKGRHTFKATLQTVGANQSLTVADQDDPGEAGALGNITVKV